MERLSAFWARILLGLAVALLAIPAAAQTTGVLSGSLTDTSGGVLPGVSVTAVHTPTGTSYNTTTDAQGRYAIPNVRVGGPYSVTAALSGFQDRVQDGIFVKLGEEANLDFAMQVASVAETITVTGDVNPLINSGKTGASASINQATIETLPTIGRSLNDFARLSPHFQTDAGRGGLVVAGKNYRYNNIQIDGAVNNDLFGLSSSGTPGGGAGTTPISLDAIQELQLVVAPYDVRLGGFTGGGINAVTRSGTNSFSGTGYYFYRNNDLVGDGPLERPLADFSNKQYGATLGGPIMRDKAFFFLSAEQTKRNAPSGFSVGRLGRELRQRGAGAARRRHPAHAATASTRAAWTSSQYGRDSNKLFGRVDVNLSKDHQLVLRHNYVKGADDNFGSLNANIYSLPNTAYEFTSKTNSTVAQLNSTFGSRRYNELRLVYTRIRDNRDVAARFPSVQVFFPDGKSVFAGTERSSTANRLDQDSFELTDDFTFYAGNHSITVGTHNEFFQFENVFIQDLFGTYVFNSVDTLALGRAQGFSRNFSRTGNPLESAKFGVKQWGFYVGDQWRVRPNVTLTLGARVDMPRFDETPRREPARRAAVRLQDERGALAHAVLAAPRASTGT